MGEPSRGFRWALDINAELGRRGAAWAYRKYLTDTTLLAAEAEARAARRGLWALPETERVAPWHWRHPSRAKRPTDTPLAMNDGGGFTCGAKRSCGQMSVCAEARHYLEACGLNRLDEDPDGIPCESICRRCSTVADCRPRPPFLIATCRTAHFLITHASRRKKKRRLLFERNMAAKMENADFVADARALLSADYRWDLTEAMETVSRELIARLPGEPWKGEKHSL